MTDCFTGFSRRTKPLQGFEAGENFGEEADEAENEEEGAGAGEDESPGENCQCREDEEDQDEVEIYVENADVFGRNAVWQWNHVQEEMGA